jgi:hypothetical protein
MKEKELYEYLAGLGIRLFVVSIGHDKRIFLHPNKITEEWRSDIKRFKAEINKKKEDEEDILMMTSTTN